MRRILLGVCLGVGLSGCNMHESVSPYQKKDLQTVMETQYLTINLPITKSEKQVLKQLLSAYDLRRTHLRFDHNLDKTVAQSLSEALQELGVLPSHISGSALMETNNANTPPITATQTLLAVDVYHITVPACPDWSLPLGRFVDHHPHHNFACANMLALAQMIRDPKDLVDPKAIRPTFDGQVALNTMQSYHNNSIQQGQSISSSSSASQSLSNSSGGGTTSNSSSGGGSSNGGGGSR
jgi:type IV pilus biogenesis protein CpaD/CtpE